VQTIVYEENEFVVGHSKKTTNQSFSLRFHIEEGRVIEPGVPDFNNRINATKFYIRTKKNDDFELLHTLYAGNDIVLVRSIVI
jgi:hypothetical protein